MSHDVGMEKVFKWTTHAEATAEEVAYWRSQSVEERVSAVELIRRVTPGVYDDAPARLERVYRLAVREPSAGSRE